MFGVPDERDGLSGSMEQSQHLLQDSKRRENELTGKVAALELQVQALSAAKEEVGMGVLVRDMSLST